MTAVATEIACPKCGGEMWDNRGKKTNPKAPDFKCKDKSCEGVIWPPKNAKPAARPALVAETKVFAADSTVLADLFMAYDSCFAHALIIAQRCKEKHTLTPTMADVGAIAATLLIAAQKKGLV